MPNPGNVTIEFTPEEYSLLCRAMLDATAYIAREKQKTYLDQQATARAEALLERYSELKDKVMHP